MASNHPVHRWPLLIEGSGIWFEAYSSNGSAHGQLNGDGDGSGINYLCGDGFDYGYGEGYGDGRGDGFGN